MPESTPASRLDEDGHVVMAHLEHAVGRDRDAMLVGLHLARDADDQRCGHVRNLDATSVMKCSIVLGRAEVAELADESFDAPFDLARERGRDLVGRARDHATPRAETAVHGRRDVSSRSDAFFASPIGCCTEMRALPASGRSSSSRSSA